MAQSPQLCDPDSPAYTTANQIVELRKLVKINLEKARKRQKQNYDKGRREGNFTENDRVWLRTHPYSKADKSFSAKLAPRWKGPYRVTRRVGPINYEFVLEDMGEEIRIVNVAQIKPCFPTAEELDRKQLQSIIKIFREESDEEDFTGLSTPDKGGGSVEAARVEAAHL